MADSDENPSSEPLKDASDSFLEGISGVLSGFVYLIRAFWVWTEDHPFLRLIILAPVSAFVSKAIFNLIGRIHSSFYGQAVPIQSDIMLQTLPLPVGLSIYLLFTLWLLTTVTAYIRIAELRERVDAIEST